MSEPATVQHALERFLDPGGLDGQRRRVCSHLLGCRTEAMGGVMRHCDHCTHEAPHWFGCRDRHCPQCQGRAIRQWAERRRADILPVRYYHVVFTLPHALNAWVQLHPEVIHRLLFASVWATVRAFGRDPKYLGGEPGMSAVLHTWGQNLSQHVHLHCLVPGGALAADGTWRATRGSYLFPVRALSRRYRGRMVAALRGAADRGELHRVTRPGEVDTLLDTLMATEWVVYTRDCLEHTGTVVDYLARYTRRIAITNARILAVDDERVTLRCRDYRDRGRHKALALDGAEFVRRFLLHVLPKGLMRVRHYGFLAKRCRREKLARIRAALAAPAPVACEPGPQGAAAIPNVCPRCRRPAMRVTGALAPRRAQAPLSREVRRRPR